MNSHCRSVAALLVMIALAFGSVDTSNVKTNDKPASPPGSNADTGTASKWYEGGTLHTKSALEWQVAGYADKLATCGDFVASMHQKDAFRPGIQDSIRSVDDMKPYATELVSCIDAATKKEPDAEANRKMYANQTVSELAAACMILMDWTKK